MFNKMGLNSDITRKLIVKIYIYIYIYLMNHKKVM